MVRMARSEDPSPDGRLHLRPERLLKAEPAVVTQARPTRSDTGQCAMQTESGQTCSRYVSPIAASKPRAKNKPQPPAPAPLLEEPKVEEPAKPDGRRKRKGGRGTTRRPKARSRRSK